jgi:tRNA pseudouridine55 synthase
MQGVLLVHKPIGWTSFDVVNYLRKIIAQAEDKRPKNVKVGHTGTLDPMATGLLVLLVGKLYTRRASELSKLDKTYEITLKLGEVSSTGDTEGETTAVSTAVPALEAVQQALERFKGRIMQTPPAFSAIKVNGQRAYKLARQGKTVTLEARPVQIHRLELSSYNYPFMELIAEVSSGTYIRSLVEDLGQTLTTGAYMTALRRTSVGVFTLEGALSVEGLTAEIVAQALQPLKQS